MASAEVNDLLKEVAQQGWTVTRQNRHIVAERNGDQVFLSSTPSDVFAIRKIKAEFRRHGAVIDGRSGGANRVEHEKVHKERQRKPHNTGKPTAKVREVLLHAEKKLTNAEIRALTGLNSRMAVASALRSLEMFGDIAKEKVPGQAGKLYWLKGRRFDVPVAEPVAAAEPEPEEDKSDALYRKLVAATVPVEQDEVELQGVPANGHSPYQAANDAQVIESLQSIIASLSSENRRLVEERQNPLIATTVGMAFAGLPPEFWEHAGRAVAALGKAR